MPGWPSLGSLVTCPNPASRSSRMVSSHPSSMPRCSAAIEGWRIHSCRRCTASSWRFSIWAITGERSSACVIGRRPGRANATAPAAVFSRKARRSIKRPPCEWARGRDGGIVSHSAPRRKGCRLAPPGAAPTLKAVASFAHQLEQLLLAAQGRGLVDSGTAERLTALAAERERERGWLSLGGVLGRLGAAVTVLGVILLIAANWHRIGDAVKILGFLTLLGGAHGVGLWIQWTGRPYPRFAEALHFLGAGLFVGGLALVGQIYQLPANPPRAMLVWRGAIVPLAVLLRSPAISGLGILAASLSLHFEGADSGSPLHINGFTSYLMLSVGMGLALLGAQSTLRQEERRIRSVMRGAAQLMLFYGVYMLGFLRRFSERTESISTGSLALPLGALVLGTAGVVLGWNRLAPEVPWLRGRLSLLPGLLVATCLVALLIDVGVIPPGPPVSVFEFGPADRFHVGTVIVSAAAWVLWFLFALRLVVYGALSRQRNFVNLGVLTFGLGIVTRFLDLIGGLADTGTLFVLGGIVLLGSAWAMERWRRAVILRIEAAT